MRKGTPNDAYKKAQAEAVQTAQEELRDDATLTDDERAEKHRKRRLEQRAANQRPSLGELIATRVAKKDEA